MRSKLFKLVLVAIIVVSMTLMGIVSVSCKKAEETVAPAEEKAEEAAEEAAPAEEEAVEEAEINPLDPKSANIDWQQFSGETISVLFSVHPWQEAVEPYIPEFEELTGIKVDLVKLPEAEFLTKVPTDMTAGTFAFDVFMTQYYDSPKYAVEHWTAELTQFLQDEKLTDPDWYDWEDFFPGAQDMATVGDTYFDRIAITSEGIIIIYREDIYQELNLTVPTTFEELLANVIIISENTDMAGITLRGGPALWHPLYGVIKSYGGGYFDENWNPIINSPEAIEGVKMYVELCKYTPPGITSYDWDEINTAMLAGEAAMFMDSSVIYPRLQDPEKSTVVGKIKVAPYPKGPAGRIPHVHYWSISIAESSEKKEAGWLFVQWVTSKDIMHKAGVNGILPPRASVWNEPDFKAAYPEDFLTSVEKALETGVISPAHTRFFEAMDIIRAEVQSVLLGEKSVEEALEFTQVEWERIMDDWKASQ